MMTVLLQDEEIQRKGVVCVEYHVGKIAILEEIRLFQRAYWMRYAIPDRIVGLHFRKQD